MRSYYDYDSTSDQSRRQVTVSEMSSFNLPPGCSDRDPYFETPSGRVDEERRTLKVTPPKTTMVWCGEGQHHWPAPAVKEFWKARIETCPEHAEANEARAEAVLVAE